MHHPLVVQSPIFNDCLKVKIDGHTKPQLVTKLLLHVSVLELHNSLVSDTEDGGLKEAIDAENNIIISYSTLRSILPPHFKNIYQDTKSCVVVSVVYLLKVYIPHPYHGVIVILKNSRIKSKMLKTEGLGENQIAYMKHMKIRSCHMGVIFTPNHIIWKRQKRVCSHSQIIRYHTGNLYCNVVQNFQVLIFLTKKQMINIPT